MRSDLKISDVLNRIGIHDIQEYFLSKEALEVLFQITQYAKNPKRNILAHIEKITPYDQMLRKQKTRRLLLDSLHPNEISILCTKLGINPSTEAESYTLLKNKSFAKNSKAERVLFDFFEQEYVEYHNEPKKSETIKDASADQPLFVYQRKTVHEISGFLNGDKRRCLLHMPTGSGKTVTAIHVISNFLLNNEPSLIIWLAYNDELCEQALDEFVHTWKNTGNRSLPIFKFFGLYSDYLLEKTKSCKDGIVFASLGKMHEADKRHVAFLSTLADRVNFVVMDEAHQATAPTYKDTLEQLVEKHGEKTRLLGLSATPGRTSDREGTDTKSLAEFFYHNKSTLKIEGFKNPIKYLISQGYLANPKLEIIKINTNLTDEDLKLIQKHHDIPKSILEKLGKDTMRTLLEINQIKSLINSGHKRIMVFGASVENSRDVSTILQILGHRAFHVDGSTPYDRRAQYIEEYKQSTEDVIILCNFGVFTTGFDAPQTSAVVVARPTKSIILYSQMVGRAMRGYKVGGNKECEIRTITDIKLTHFSNLVDNFFEWEDIW